MLDSHFFIFCIKSIEMARRIKRQAKVEDISKIEKNILCFACIIMKSLLYLHCNQKHKGMDKKELKQQLLHKRMEAKAKLEVLRSLGVIKFDRQIDKLLDRINEIDKLLRELEK